MTKRNIEKELIIDAEPEVVWQAFTQADKICNWFAPNAESEPGVGGFIKLSWDSAEANPYCHILEWEENHRLLMTWRDAPGGEHPLPVELTLTRQDGGTLLRLVHSGFLSDASWDDEFASHSRGWSYELRSLKLYVEAHFNKTRSYVLERFPVKGERAAVWKKIVAAAGLLESGKQLLEGDTFRFSIPDMQDTQATLLFALDDTDFAFIADVLEGGLFRFAYENFGDKPEIWVWAFSWSLADDQLRKRVAPMFENLRAIINGPDKSNVA